MRLFWLQYKALFIKNYIVLRRRALSSFLRFLVFPIAYGIFLAYAQNFFKPENNFGLGTITTIPNFQRVFDGSTSLLWADVTRRSGYISPTNIMSRVTSGFEELQLHSVIRVNSMDEINKRCVTSFNGASPCFAAITFERLPLTIDDTGTINYTIRTENPIHIDVEKHDSDMERKILPLQWAVDKAIIELTTGRPVPTPHEWPFTNISNEELDDKFRLSFLKLMNNFLALAFILIYLGIVYQMCSSVTFERASMLTEHLKSMGASDLARNLSWLTSMSLAYMPAWFIVSMIWKFRLFTHTNLALIIAIHMLTGVGMASWSIIVTVPFGKNPQLAAVFTTGLAILLALFPIMLNSPSTAMATVLSLLFPPMFYMFSLKAICGFELLKINTNATVGDPNTGLVLLALMLASLAGIALSPFIAILLESFLYSPSWRAQQLSAMDISSKENLPIRHDICISIKNLHKTYPSGQIWKSKPTRAAITDLNLDIPKNGIFVLLGSNGAGKSTILSILANMSRPSSGTIIFEGGVLQLPRGTLGVVPQKDVLFPELTCLETLRVWSAVKAPTNLYSDEELLRLLVDCDLSQKIHSPAFTLSGGQKRKLQLAIGLVADSKIVLVDECTSGVDPLSRRALWKILTSYREERTIVLTTHFLDEADFLADQIAILVAPGKLVAEGTPVSLKSSSENGYSVLVEFSTEVNALSNSHRLLGLIRSFAPSVHLSSRGPFHLTYHLRSQNIARVAKVLKLVDRVASELAILSYDILGTTLEDIFLEHTSDSLVSETKKSKPSSILPQIELTDGCPQSAWAQARTVFRKRVVIARRSWIIPLLAIILGIGGSLWPLRFVTLSEKVCSNRTSISTPLPLFPPINFASASVLVSPAEITTSIGLPPLGNSSLAFRILPDNTTFVRNIKLNHTDIFPGGVSVDLATQNTLIAWVPALQTLPLFSLATNFLYNNALNSASLSSPRYVIARYQNFPRMNHGDLLTLRWVVFFGAAMAVYPAVCALYVYNERHSSIQAMQLSNGLSNPLGLWLGHIMFDAIPTIVVASIVIGVLSTVEQFHGLGYLWLIFVLYGIMSTLFAYLFSTFVGSSLAAFVLAAGYQFIILLVYLTSYVATLNFALPARFTPITTTVHFTLSLTAPIVSLTRAALLSINQFSLLCDGDALGGPSSMASMSRFGSPIFYLIFWGIALLLAFDCVDTGSFRSKVRFFFNMKRGQNLEQSIEGQNSFSDSLYIQNIVKSFNGIKVVENFSLTVPRDSVFAMLGPNGAGKTTTFNIIRGEVKPDSGDAFVDRISILTNTKLARQFIGVCPQFSAIDSQLTVKEHLLFYGRLKGLKHGYELSRNVDSLLLATKLDTYADLLASHLSGGNQRKLALAIALLGNPPVILVDEFSTGIDAKMKRELWSVLRNVVVNKSVLLTTHSMEEAASLATDIIVMSKRILASGTPEQLEAEYGTYELQFSCRTQGERSKSQLFMTQIPDSRKVDDVANRFEVPIGRGGKTSLADLFHLLSKANIPEFVVSKSTLENAFIKIVKSNQASEVSKERPCSEIC